TRRNAPPLVHVRDDVGRPVQGATITVGSSLPPATTDASGEAFVDRLTWGDRRVDLAESAIVGDRGRYCCRRPRNSVHIEPGGMAELLFEVERTGHLVARLEDSSCVGGDALLRLGDEPGGIHVATPDVPLKAGSSHRFEQL